MAAQPPFALHPAEAIPGVIDLTTREGIKLYQDATRSFYSDPTVIQFPPEMVENWWRYGGEVVTK